MPDTRVWGIQWWSPPSFPMHIDRDSFWEQWSKGDITLQHHLLTFRCSLSFILSILPLKEIPLMEERDCTSVSASIVGTCSTNSLWWEGQGPWYWICTLTSPSLDTGLSQLSFLQVCPPPPWEKTWKPLRSGDNKFLWGLVEGESGTLDILWGHG